MAAPLGRHIIIVFIGLPLFDLLDLEPDGVVILIVQNRLLTLLL